MAVTEKAKAYWHDRFPGGPPPLMETDPAENL